jgi:hypothetical protein
MTIKRLISVFLLLMAFVQVSKAQEKTTNNVTPDEINKAVSKLFEYYESYEDGSTQSQKNAKFDNAFDVLTKGSATSKDKNDAFKIVDAYIKADQKPSTIDETNGKQNDFIKKTDEYKEAEKAINNGLNNLMNMSYPEFESTVLKLQPNSSKREIKGTYNNMHRNDGKKVPITTADDEMTPQQQMMWAIKTIENPKNYDEFVKAAKILDPKIPETKLRKGWERIKTR